MLASMHFRAALPLLFLSACVFDSSNFAPSAFEDGGQPDAPSTGIDAALADAALTDAAAPDAGIADASPTDAAPDAAPDAQVCVGDLLGFAPLNMDGCDPLSPAGAITISGLSDFKLNTDTGVLIGPGGSSTLPFVVVTQIGGPDLFVTTATNFTIDIGSTLDVTGSRPFVLVATGDITINGRLSALGRGTSSGAGGNLDGDCATLGRGAPGAVQSSGGKDGGSGGGGGGFGGAGGEGALVDGTAGANSAAGAASIDTDLVPLRGGCAGGTGGLSGGAGGGAGGAIQLVAGGSITHLASISVSGGGGQGVAGASSGGGGGGSGGGLLLQAPSISGLGVLTANGGGGGEGSRSGTSTLAGTDGLITLELVALGGAGSSNGGDGGNGGTLSTPATSGSPGNSNGSTLAGGGGGGGGEGRIVQVTP